MKDYIDDITGLLENAANDLIDPADIVDFANEIIAAAVKIRAKAQIVIDADVEYLVDSFGGDITERQLKGE